MTGMISSEESEKIQCRDVEHARTAPSTMQSCNISHENMK